MKQTTKFLHIVMCMVLGLSVSMTSCKDYDDDIESLRQEQASQQTALDDLEALENQVNQALSDAQEAKSNAEEALNKVNSGEGTEGLDEETVKQLISDAEEKLQGQIDKLTTLEDVKSEIESYCDLKVIRSTPTMVDIIDNKVDKTIAVDRLLNKLNIKWSDISVIGDTNSDLGCIQKAGLGVTLENGSEACKDAADMIVPSCYDDGCIMWLDRILEDLR